MFQCLFCCFGLQYIVVFELPIDAATVVRAVGDRKVQDIGGLCSGNGDMPTLFKPKAQPRGIASFVLVVIRAEGAKALAGALDGVLGNPS